MKRTIVFLITLLFIIRISGQGVDCGTASPFCTGTTINFPAVTDIPSPIPLPAYPNYGCLTDIKNPSWYYMKIGNPGNLVIHISTSPAHDVDFICWGPFDTLTACSGLLTGNCSGYACNGGTCPDNVGACNVPPSFYPSGNIVDCSASIQQMEDCHINAAITGQYYILLITNYDNAICNIIFAQSNVGQAGAGTTDCGILPIPVSCNGPLCVGDTLKLKADTIPGANYFWSGPNSFTSNLQNPILTNVTAADAGYYKCHIVVIAQASPEDSVLVVVNPKPTVTAPSLTIWNGDSAVITASGANIYYWNTPSNDSINPLVVTPNTTTNYIVIGKNTFGCKDTANVTVTVNPGPPITVNSPTICIGDIATLTASGGLSYIWSDTQIINPITVNPIVTTTYTVKGKDINNCIGTATATVTVNQPPAVQISNDTTICSGTQVVLTASGGVGYSWTYSGGGGETTPSISVNPSVLTTYTVVVTDATGCKNDTTVTVKTTPSPVPYINLSSDTICAGTLTEISATGGTTFYWSPGGETTSTISVEPNANTIYSVTVSTIVNNILCSATTSVVQNVRNCNSIFIPNSFSPVGHNKIFKPAGNISNIADYLLQIWDRWGQLLFETTNHAEGWDGKIKGQIAPVGVYVYHIKVNDKINPVFEKVGTVTLLR